LIAVDSNILVYAHRRDSPHHSQADAAVTGLAEGGEPWGVPWPCVHEFLAVATNPRAYDPPSSTDSGLEQLMKWMESPTLSLLAEGPGYVEALAEILRSSGAIAGQIHDARIAALCIYHGASELWTTDRDFRRFPTLRTRNPVLP
jgi:toxin-antitoxin system PIN domain toxin